MVAAVLALLLSRLDGAFFVFGVGRIHAGSVFDGAWKDDGVSAGINQSREVHQDFGAALEVSGGFDLTNFALHVGSGGDHDAVVHHHRECALGVDGIAYPAALGGDGVLEHHGNTGSLGNGDFVSDDVRGSGRQGRRRGGLGVFLGLGGGESRRAESMQWQGAFEPPWLTLVCLPLG